MKRLLFLNACGLGKLAVDLDLGNYCCFWPVFTLVRKAECLLLGPPVFRLAWPDPEPKTGLRPG